MIVSVDDLCPSNRRRGGDGGVQPRLLVRVEICDSFRIVNEICNGDPKCLSASICSRRVSGEIAYRGLRQMNGAIDCPGAGVITASTVEERGCPVLKEEMVLEKVVQFLPRQ